MTPPEKYNLIRASIFIGILLIAAVAAPFTCEAEELLQPGINAELSTLSLIVAVAILYGIAIILAIILQTRK